MDAVTNKDPEKFSVLANRRYRLYISLIIALIVFFITVNRVTATVSFMFTWIAFAGSNLLFSWIIILSFHPIEVKAVAREEDSSSTFIFLFVVMAAFISLFAILFLLQSMPAETKSGLSRHILLSILSVFCSWCLIHTLFALKYAHKYYDAANFEGDSNKQQGPGLLFPDENEPDFLDFAYFSFVIGMTFQVSDVQITSKKIRRLALLHGFLSFVYNTVIVALSINIVSGIISKQ